MIENKECSTIARSLSNVAKQQAINSSHTSCGKHKSIDKWGRKTYVYRPSILHSRGDDGAPAGVDAASLLNQSPLYKLAVHVNGDNVAVHRNAQLVPQTVEKGVQVAAPERVAESVLQQTLKGKLHGPLAAVDHDRYLLGPNTVLKQGSVPHLKINLLKQMSIKDSIYPPDWFLIGRISATGTSGLFW